MSDLSGSVAAAETTASTPAEPTKQLTELEQVDQLLSGKPPEKAAAAAPPGDGAAASEGQQDPDTEQETDAGEGDGASTVDYTQEIPLSNGEKMTLGELKDHYQGYAAKVVDLIDRENKVMGQYQQLQEMSQYLNLPAEKRQEIAQQQVQHLREQHGLMLEAIPEWKDQAVFEKARLDIHNLGTEYGVDLSRVTDHRVVKMLNDYAKLRGRSRRQRPA